MRELIVRTLRGEELRAEDAKRTIFPEILDSKLPPSDKTQQRLEDEAQIVIGGGVETTAFALAIASFHIIDKSHVYDRLHADLVAAFPRGEALELMELEQMPYLKACIMEAVRLGYGLSARNPRTHGKDLRYKEWVIPAGTCISMSIPDVSHDEDIFPQSHDYIPERWMDEPKSSDDVPLDRFMVSFGRGTRACLGIT
jgi:cytochrome P450